MILNNNKNNNLKLPFLLILLAISQGISQATASGLVQHKSSPPQQQQQQQQHHNIQQQQQQSQQHMQQAQYVHEKDSLHDSMKNEHLTNSNIEDDLGDTYQILNDIKPEARLPAPPSGANYLPWNWFPQFSPIAMQQNTPSPMSHSFESLASSALHAPKFSPFFGYPQPIFIPYPMYIAPDMFYPTAPAFASDIEESMSRAADGRRSSSANSAYQRNSPIYYMRLPPPPPYMFLPGLGFTTAASSLNHPQPASSFGSGFSSMMSYNALPSFTAYSSIFNPPVNFLANGKPTNIYQMSGSPNDIQQSPMQFAGLSGFGSRPPSPNPYRPFSSLAQNNGNYLQQSAYGTVSAPQQDSKLTALKRPFIFNGRPEEIYILPNNFNPLYSDTSLSGYY